MIIKSPQLHLAGLRLRQRGLTLVEVLVTVVIISVGLLGIAALHLTSLKNGYDSNSRSRATWLANDIADRMRANATAAEAGSYNVVIGGTLAGASTAVTDVTQWKNQLNLLLGGDGSIQVNPAGSDFVASIVIQWNERGTPGAATQLQMQFGI